MGLLPPNRRETAPYVTKADQVFPYFVSTHMPTGLAGVFMASLIGAAMSMLASDLNCIAAVGVEDFYRPARPLSDEAGRLRPAKKIVAAVGLLTTAIAAALAHTKGGALAMWFAVSAVTSGGLAGLFLLAFFSRRANRRGIYCGIGASLAVTVWATLTGPSRRLLDLGPWNYTWDDLTVGAVGHVVLMTIGYAASLLLSGQSEPPKSRRRFWQWVRSRPVAASIRGE